MASGELAKGSVVTSVQRHPAAQLNAPLINETSEALGDGFLGSVEAVLVVRHPVHLTLGDYAGGHRFEEQFAEGHLTAAAAACTLFGLFRVRMTSTTFFMRCQPMV